MLSLSGSREACWAEWVLGEAGRAFLAMGQESTRGLRRDLLEPGRDTLGVCAGSRAQGHLWAKGTVMGRQVGFRQCGVLAPCRQEDGVKCTECTC